MATITVRLPDELHDKLTYLAEGDHRSLNGEIVHLLETAVARELPELETGPCLLCGKPAVYVDNDRFCVDCSVLRATQQLLKWYGDKQS